MNSLTENQHPHRWIPDVPDFITLVYDSTKIEPLYFFCGGNHSYWPLMECLLFEILIGSIDFIKIQTEVYLSKTYLHLFSLESYILDRSVI